MVNLWKSLPPSKCLDAGKYPVEYMCKTWGGRDRCRRRLTEARSGTRDSLVGRDNR